MNNNYINGADPWIIYQDGFYYYSYSYKDGIYVYKMKTINDLNRKGKLIYKTSNKTNPWTPEIHYINNMWYIYYAQPKSGYDDRRMYVLSSKNPLGPYKFEGQITDETDKWAIDGTVLKWNQQLYFIWSGWEKDENVCQNLYIAHMSSPTKIDGKRVLISKPEYNWEKHGIPLVNEGPEVLIKDGRLFIIYSASGSWTKYYCLGMLSFIGDDLLDKKSWKKSSKPIFESNGDILAPGHACFVKEDGEDYIIFHCFPDKDSVNWEKRIIRKQKFVWKKGIPNFYLNKK